MGLVSHPPPSLPRLIVISPLLLVVWDLLPFELETPVEPSPHSGWASDGGVFQLLPTYDVDDWTHHVAAVYLGTKGLN